MISNLVQKEIRARMPGIMDSYGGISNFISYVREYLKIPVGQKEIALSDYSKASFYSYINTLLNYSNDVIVLSPWSLFLDLRDTLDSSVSNDSINLEEPYKVYTLEGDLIYTVKNHFGAFGESRLDKQLVVNSSNASAYFLKFKTYSGLQKIKLLLVNLYSRNTVVSNKFLNTPPTLQTSTLSFVNNTGISLDIYKTESSIVTDPSFSFKQDNKREVVAPNDIKIYNVEKSAYFFIDAPVKIQRTVITNPLNDLIFQTPLSTQLLFVGTNVDVTTLNKVFNKGIQYSNKPIQDVITLTPSTPSAL